MHLIQGYQLFANFSNVHLIVCFVLIFYFNARCLGYGLHAAFGSFSHEMWFDEKTAEFD